MIVTPAEHGRTLHPVGSTGMVVLAWRDGSRWREMSVRVEELAEVLSSFAGRVDAYMAQNRFWGRRRRINSLVALDAVFCDVDYYTNPNLAYLHPWAILEAALDALSEAKMPGPSLAISTGRGISLLWLHEPIPRQALPRWNACQKQVYQTLKHLGADPLAKDAARVLRLIGTRHSKTDKVVEALTPTGEIWPFSRLADELLPYTREELYELRLQRAQQRREHKLWIPREGLTVATLWATRLDDLQHLRNLRWFGELPPGHRDRWLVTAATAMSWLTEPRHMRRDMTGLAEEVTGGAWRERDVRSNMATVFARAEQAAKGVPITVNGKEIDARYRLKNETIIDWLQITPDEQREMKTIIGDDEKRDRRLARRQRQREVAGGTTRDQYLAEAQDRRDRARELRAAGLSLRQIGREIGVSHEAVRKMLADDVLATATARASATEAGGSTNAATGRPGLLETGVPHYTKDPTVDTDLILEDLEEGVEDDAPSHR